MKQIQVILSFLLAICMLIGCAPKRLTLFSESVSAENGAYRQPEAPSLDKTMRLSSRLMWVKRII